MNNEYSSVSKLSIEWFLYAMYTGYPPELTPTVALDVLDEFSHKFVLSSITERCSNYLIQNLSLLKVSDLFRISLLIKEPIIWDYINDQFLEIFNQLQQHPEYFASVHVELMAFLVSRALYDSISFDVILYMFRSWIRYAFNLQSESEDNFHQITEFLLSHFNDEVIITTPSLLKQENSSVVIDTFRMVGYEWYIHLKKHVNQKKYGWYLMKSGANKRYIVHMQWSTSIKLPEHKHRSLTDFYYKLGNNTHSFPPIGEEYNGWGIRGCVPPQCISEDGNPMPIKITHHPFKGVICTMWERCNQQMTTAPISVFNTLSLSCKGRWLFFSDHILGCQSKDEMIDNYILAEPKLCDRIHLVRKCIRWIYVVDPVTVIRKMIQSCGIYTRYIPKMKKAIAKGIVDSLKHALSERRRFPLTATNHYSLLEKMINIM